MDFIIPCLYLIAPIGTFIYNVLKKKKTIIIINVILIIISIIVETYYYKYISNNNLVENVIVSFYEAIYILSVAKLIYLKTKNNDMNKNYNLLFGIGLGILVLWVIARVIENMDWGISSEINIEIQFETHSIIRKYTHICFVNIPIINFFIAVCTKNKDEKDLTSTKTA